MKHALELDRKNGNTFWRDAIAKEMGSFEALRVFEILDRGKGPPKGYQMIPMWIIFDVKMNLTRKARLVAGGHVTNRTRTLKGLLEAGLAFPFLVELSYTHA